MSTLLFMRKLRYSCFYIIIMVAHIVTACIYRRRMYGNYNRSDPSIATWITHPILSHQPKDRTPSPPHEAPKPATPPSWSESQRVCEEAADKPPLAPIDSGTEITLQPSVYTRKLIGPAPVVALWAPAGWYYWKWISMFFIRINLNEVHKHELYAIGSQDKLSFFTQNCMTKSIFILKFLHYLWLSF